MENSKQIQFEEYKNKIEEYFNGEGEKYKGEDFQVNLIKGSFGPEIKVNRKFISKTFLEHLNTVLYSLDNKLTYIVNSNQEVQIF